MNARRSGSRLDHTGLPPACDATPGSLDGTGMGDGGARALLEALPTWPVLHEAVYGRTAFCGIALA